MLRHRDDGHVGFSMGSGALRVRSVPGVPSPIGLMIVAGRVSVKMAPVIRQIYDQMPDPKWVIAMGACASTGGVFNNYAVVQGVDQIVPVDVYVPGCPPSPDMLMYGFTMLQDKIRPWNPTGFRLGSDQPG